MTDTDEKKHVVTIDVNGARRIATVEARKLLVHLLRDDLGLTGTHVGCDTSQCGACTVDIDGQAVKSCTVLAVMADGSSITTIEGLAPGGGALHSVQAAFHEHHALQCGFCTPGMIMAVRQLLKQNPIRPKATSVTNSPATSALHRLHQHRARSSIPCLGGATP